MTRPSSAPASLPHPAGIGDAPGARSDDALRPEPLLGRRDVALTPWVAIAVLALAYGVSEVLRNGLGADQLLIAAGAAGVAGFAAAIALTVDQPTFVPLRSSMVVYALGAGGVIAVLGAIGALSDGLQTVVLTSLVLMAMYLGLVLTVRWSGGFTAAMLATAAAVHVIRPDAGLLDALSVFALTLAGWILGVLCRAAHLRAERMAMRLTRCDLLTATLNRRGLIEELEAKTRRARLAEQPVALMIFDLDGFKKVNTDRGNAAGDELLAWVGGVLGALLPPKAAAGRLGSDEFAVAITGLDRRSAGLLAKALCTAIGERHPVSVGVATSENGMVNAIDLVRVADAAMRVCKADPAIDVHSLVVGGFRNIAESSSRAADHPPVSITYERLRQLGGRPRRPKTSVAFGWLVRAGFIVIGLAGVVVVGIVIADGHTDFYSRTIQWLGIPWILANFAYALTSSGPGATDGRRLTVVFVGSNLLSGIGVSATALSTGGGIASPIIVALSLKVAFDAAIGNERQARVTLAAMTGLYLLVAALGPAAALWAMPIGLAQLWAAFALGSLSRRAVDDSTGQWVELSRSDVLTGLANRVGFDEDTHAAIDVASNTGQRLALLAIDLDGFKLVNETDGPVAGDALLQRVADVIRAVLSDAVAAGRLGGDEFVAAVPVGSLEEADQLSTLVERAIAGVIGSTVGCAVYPDDGSDVETLVRAADLRCRAIKAARLQAAAD